MDKRYQIFVSSTYTDLRDERAKVIQTLMEMDCIPAGMELFPAADEEQWNFIKRVIDDCDYYLLIIGGRYGSVTPEGISYTEKEYDYAVERGLKVVALIHESPEQIPSSKTERSPEAVEKLSRFRDKVSNGRLVKFWSQADQLPGLVALSLSKTIKTYPAVGWVRANAIANTEALTELNEARKRIKILETQAAKLQEELRERAAAEYGGRTFHELCDILIASKIKWKWDDGTTTEMGLGDAVVCFADTLALGVSNAKNSSIFETDLFFKVAKPLLIYNLTEFLPVPNNVHWQRIGLTAAGRRFVAEVRKVVEQKNAQQRALDSLHAIISSGSAPESIEHTPTVAESMQAAPSNLIESTEHLTSPTEAVPAASPASPESETTSRKMVSSGAAKKKATPSKGKKHA